MAQTWIKGANRGLLVTVAGSLLITVGLTGYGIVRFNAVNLAQEEAAVAPVPSRQVAALGRLEPATEVVQLDAPLSLDGDRVLELRVQEGDSVEAGQVIAVLDSRDRLQGAVRQAEERVRVAEARLSQVLAGAQDGTLQAQEAAIARIEAEISGTQSVDAATLSRLSVAYETAQREYERFSQLFQDGAISASQLDSYRLAAATAEAELQEAQSRRGRELDTLAAQRQEAIATLDELAEVRPADVNFAQAEVEEAIAALQQAQVDLEKTYIRAPLSGQILKIHTRPGEQLSDQGIADLGQTDQMQVVAEVYQTDIRLIQVGQSATVTSQAFDGELTGTVERVGLQVNRQSVFSNQPGENLDRRVIDVIIRLTPESSRRVSQLSNMQVEVFIDPES